MVTFATFLVCGSPDPFSTPAALSSMRAAGGVLVTKVNERSSYTEISTGTTSPRCDSVAALYALQNSMMLTPCWPSAGPTGGAGLAMPALICSLMIAASFFFFGGISCPDSAGSDFCWVWVTADLPPPTGLGAGADGKLGQILATWENDSSTGVSRPKIETRTLS